jgi:hypothetical protein
MDRFVLVSLIEMANYMMQYHVYSLNDKAR